MDHEKWTAVVQIDQWTAHERSGWTWSLTIRREGQFFGGASGGASSEGAAHRQAWEHTIERIRLIDSTYQPAPYGGMPAAQLVHFVY